MSMTRALGVSTWSRSREVTRPRLPRDGVSRRSSVVGLRDARGEAEDITTREWQVFLACGTIPGIRYRIRHAGLQHVADTATIAPNNPFWTPTPTRKSSTTPNSTSSASTVACGDVVRSKAVVEVIASGRGWTRAWSRSGMRSSGLSGKGGQGCTCRKRKGIC